MERAAPAGGPRGAPRAVPGEMPDSPGGDALAELQAIAARESRQSLPLLALAAAIGVLGALGARAFHAAIDAAAWLFRSPTAPLGDRGAPLSLLLGGLALLALERAFPGEVLGYGFPRFLEMLHLGEARVKRRWAVLKALGAATSLGAGAAVGREGPIAQIGGSLAAIVAGLARRSGGERKVLVACGAAAGIAATFDAPIGAVLFAQEIVLLGEAELGHLSLVVVAAATSTAATRGMFGGDAALRVTPFALGSYWSCVTYAALGIALGLLAVGYVRVFHRVAAALGRLPAPRWAVLLAGLAVVGLIDVWLPQNVSDGYPVIDQALRGGIAWRTAALLAAAKIATSALSLGCGAPGGVFGPIFFIGAMAGVSFHALSELAVPQLTGPRGAYALVGLGGFLAATTHAPLTALFLLLEMTADYDVALPALLSIGLALLVATRLEPGSIDTYSLRAEGKRLHGPRGARLLDAATVEVAYRRDATAVAETARLREVLRAIDDARGPSLPVVDAAGELVGVLSFAALRVALAEEPLSALVIARDLCAGAVATVTPRTPLAEAFRRIDAAGVDELVVVDPRAPRRVLGVLSRADLIATYNRLAAIDGAPGTAAPPRAS